MTTEARQILTALLIRHEGIVLHAYPDSLGYLTIGVGHLIDVRKGGGITNRQALSILEDDIDAALVGVYQQLPWVATLDPVRQVVIASMVFQMGIAGVLQFKRTLALIRERDFGRASDAMLQSLWATQTPARARELATAMRFGNFGGDRSVSV